MYIFASLVSKIFPFRVDTSSEGLGMHESKQKVTKVVSLVKNGSRSAVLSSRLKEEIMYYALLRLPTYIFVEKKKKKNRWILLFLGLLTLVLLNPDILSFCKQCKSRSVGFFRSQLIWICTVCHGLYEFMLTICIKESHWLKIRSGWGILIYSA